MKRCYVMATVAMITILSGSLATATLIDGVVSQGDEAPRIQQTEPLFRLPFEVMIDFDDTLQPCGFMETIALTDEYLDLGVVFSGPNPGDGGGVLNECGGFSVSGHSPPNFLAFNCQSGFQDDHTPVGPERLDFSVPVTVVSALVGSGSGAGSNLTLDAYDEDGTLVDSNNLTLDWNLQEITVEAFAISYVIFGQDAPCVWVLDDLGFDRGPVDVESETWSRVKSLYR